MIRFHSLPKFDTDAVIILLDKSNIQKKSFASISLESARNAVRDTVASGLFQGEDRELFPLIVRNQLFLLAGTGDSAKHDFTSLRTTVRQAAISPFLKKAKSVEIILPDKEDQTVIAVIEGLLIGTYSWKKYLNQKNASSFEHKTYALAVSSKPVLDQAIRICDGVNLARNLINDNADVVDSAYLEKTIKDLIKGEKNISLEILNRKELKAKGLNLHLAVNQGSPKEPKLIIVKYEGAGKNNPYTALLGKGITFDTGGLNLKPTGHIETMRSDMSGAAAVIGTLKNVISLKLKKNLIFAVGIAENAIGSLAYKPGDVFQSYNGKTVEILNTDAEGRLVLADALAYLTKNYAPGRIIDLATLTGACVIALGNDYSGMVTNNDEFGREVSQAAQQSDDRVWPLPSYKEIRDYVKSEIADLKNVGLPKGAGGAITAAEFLRQFVADTPWVHLDIAGTAYVDGKSRMYFGHGATGAGVRLLSYLLKS